MDPQVEIDDFNEDDGKSVGSGDHLFLLERFVPYKLSDIAKRTKRPWLLEHVIRPTELGMVYGASGSGKSFVSVDLIVAAILGQPWANGFFIPEPLRVAYIAGEGTEMIASRFVAALKHRGWTDICHSSLDIYEVPVQLLEDVQDGVPTFVSDVKMIMTARGDAEPPFYDLIVFDTLHSCAMGIDENSSRDVGRIINAMKRVARELGSAVIVVHHANRAGTGERGSSALRAACDVILEITAPKGQIDPEAERKLSCSKLKDGRWWRPVTFRLIPAGTDEESAYIEWMDSEDVCVGTESTKTKIVNLVADQWMTNREIAEKLGVAVTTIKDHTRKLVADCKVSSRMRGKSLEYAAVQKKSGVPVEIDEVQQDLVGLGW